MSTAIAVYHGAFGRVTLYHLDKPMIKHVHREGHLCFWVSGAAATTIVDGTPCRMSPDTGAAINPWQIHNYMPESTGMGQHLLVLYIRESWFQGCGGSAVGGLRFGKPQIPMTPRIANLVAGIATLLTGGGKTDYLDGHLFDLTSESFVQSRMPGPASDQRICSAVIDFRVRKSIRHMIDNVGDPLDLRHVARWSGISRPHFFKMFRDQTGVTPKLYWNTLRMERALIDLAETGKPITDIGLDLGFSSQSSFSRFFALNTGLSPTEYRRAAHVLNA
jgi:AraC-like DNA-binding protein